MRVQYESANVVMWQGYSVSLFFISNLVISKLDFI